MLAMPGLLAGCSHASVPTQGRTRTLVDAARSQIHKTVKYDSVYSKIVYPMGDVPLERGVCTDVIIRAYRQLGLDLQQLVHEDMAANFDLYPKRWELTAPDPNIDHRRVPNLMVFFSRFAESLPVSKNAADYRPGDIITNLPFGRTHIAIVGDRKSWRSGRLMLIQNGGLGAREDDELFTYPLTGHYRYSL
ncbi:hypothetical protein ABAC460_19180 [Asticcacaulis sp. AC460]|uniref:DUF1287 domain-containing protein n=1 Tax=Asticcacaulis sp. AC460 TaxID=1282360 RepID=UPI0003C3B1FE|nr:DUF1287 domain-containing protein [Asticcacaulis sp. AC460]ESQ87451.1 hypothetical protein ABAC460_19180 [Asticcacaulis sp. AC460]